MAFDDRIPLPPVAPTGGSLVSISINPAWLKIVIGALELLLLDETFDGDPETAYNYVNDLIGIFADAV